MGPVLYYLPHIYYFKNIPVALTWPARQASLLRMLPTLTSSTGPTSKYGNFRHAWCFAITTWWILYWEQTLNQLQLWPEVSPPIKQPSPVGNKRTTQHSYSFRPPFALTNSVLSLLVLEQTAAENKMFLLQQFLNYQYKEGHDISSHVTAIELMASQLRDVRSPVSDDQVITKIA